MVPSGARAASRARVTGTSLLCRIEMRPGRVCSADEWEQAGPTGQDEQSVATDNARQSDSECPLKFMRNIGYKDRNASLGSATL